MRCLARNFRSRFGEIDLVMLDGSTVVFVEVRLRRRAHHGSAGDSVDRRKQARLAAAAALFLARNRQVSAAAARFDVIAFDGEPTPGEPLRMRWIRGAFDH